MERIIQNWRYFKARNFKIKVGKRVQVVSGFYSVEVKIQNAVFLFVCLNPSTYYNRRQVARFRLKYRRQIAKINVELRDFCRYKSQYLCISMKWGF